MCMTLKINPRESHTTLSFKDWMNAVNKVCLSIIGMTAYDLPDRNWHDAYDDGTTVQEAVDDLMEEIEDGVL